MEVLKNNLSGKMILFLWKKILKINSVKAKKIPGVDVSMAILWNSLKFNSNVSVRFLSWQSIPIAKHSMKTLEF